VIKACIFVLYIWIIGFIPDIRRVFQYHGAEHKSISTFENGEELTVENAKNTQLFTQDVEHRLFSFYLFISIIIFSVLFTFVPVGTGLASNFKACNS
jgi:uncharacterized protein YqhQ